MTKKKPPRPLGPDGRGATRDPIPRQRGRPAARGRTTGSSGPPPLEGRVVGPVEGPMEGPVERPVRGPDGPPVRSTLPVPRQPAEARRRRTGLRNASLLAVLVLLVVGLGAAVLGLPEPDRETGARSDPGSTTGEVPGSQQNGAPAPRPFTRTPPAAVPAVGSYVVSRIPPSGLLDVTHWVRTPEPVREITLAVPERTGPEQGQAAIGITVAAGDDFVPGPLDLGAGTATYRFPHPSSLIFVHYTVRGALVVSTTLETRALARFTSLDVDYEGQAGPVRLAVVGRRIRSVACASAPPDPPTIRPCGSSEPGRWQVTLRGDRRDDRVVAQVDRDSLAEDARGAAEAEGQRRTSS